MPVPPNPPNPPNPPGPPRRPASPPGQQRRPAAPPQRPSKPAAVTNDEIGFYAGVISVVLGVASIFVLSTVLVPMAAVAGIYAIMQKRPLWGVAGLFCALSGVFSSPALTSMLGIGHSGGRGVVTSVSDVFPQISKKDEQDEINRQRAATAMDDAVQVCRTKRLAGEYKTYLEAAKCSHDASIDAFRKIGYPYMDLVEAIVKEREALAEQLDKGQISEDDAEETNDEFLDQVADELASRERKAGH